MRALIFEGPAPDTSRTRVADLPEPTPAPGQVSIDVHFAGINFKDVMMRRGDRGYVTRWPVVPGLEVAGTARALGAGVTEFEIGERVAALTNSGGLAEVALARAPLTAPVPPDVPLERAAIAPGVMTSAALLLDKFARLQEGETLLVHSAAGGMGRALAARARRIGVGMTLGTVGSSTRVAAAQAAGYDHVVVRGSNLADQIHEQIGSPGVDVILDPQGTLYLQQDLQLAAPAGRIIIFGNAAGTELEPLPAAGTLITANVSIGGFSLASLSEAAPHMIGGALKMVLHDLLTNNERLDLEIVEDLKAAAAAQQALAEGKANGKLVARIHPRSS